METYLKELDTELKAVVSRLKDELRGLRSNRPSVEGLEDLPVSVYGQMMTVKQLGSLSVQQREIQINVWDKAAVGAVMGAINDAKLGFSLQNEGNIIRAFLPQLSSERRDELAKQAKKVTEEFRVQVRSHRDDINKKVKAAEEEKELTEDEAFNGKKKIQEVVDKANKDIDNLLENKIKEIQE